MIMRTRSFKSTVAGTLLIFGAMPSVSSAIPTGSHYMVSPPSCQPSESSISDVSAATSASRLELINGAWTFRSGQTGYAELSCPINFSGGSGTWSLIQLWYRDGFAAVDSDNGYVEADLMRRLRNSSGAAQIAATASTFGTGDEYGHYTNDSLPAGPNDLEMYFLRVRLNRSNTSRSVAFTGLEIRFQ
jgi:hypothetical protein